MKKNLASNRLNSKFYKRHLDLDPMTLVLKLYLDMGQGIPPYQKNEVSRSRHSNVID